MHHCFSALFSPCIYICNHNIFLINTENRDNSFPISLSQSYLPQEDNSFSLYIFVFFSTTLQILSLSLIHTNMSVTLSFSYLFVFLVIISSKTFITPSSSATNSFVFGGCSQLKYTSGSPYENNVNSLLTSLVNSAMSTTYNNFTVPGIESPQDTLYGLFQCRGDLMGNDCSRCVAFAVSQLGTLCVDSFGGALQLEGCFVKYDNTSFLGVEDKTEVVKKCGPSIGYDSERCCAGFLWDC